MKLLTRTYIMMLMAVVFLFIQIALGQQIIREDELATISREAISTTQVSARQQIEDRLYGTENALCRADNSCYTSNQDYLDDLTKNLKALITTESTYFINVYGIDYEKGLLDVEIVCGYRILGKNKMLSVRKTSIVEVVGVIKEE